MRQVKKTVGVLLVLTLLCGLFCAALPASAADGYTNHRLSLISEPSDMSEEVVYNKNGAAADKSAMTWVDGVHGGKALSFDGVSEYLAFQGGERFWLESLSFACWVKWQGSADATNIYGAMNQRLFTLFTDSNKFMTYTPYSQNYQMTNLDGGVLDGMLLQYRRSEPDAEVLAVDYAIDAFDSAVQGYTSYALPMNEWHHVAFVADGKTLKLYIDGALHFDETLMITMLQMAPTVFTIGSGLFGEPLLHAAVDEAALYDMALSADQVNYVMSGGDPAGLATAQLASTTNYIPSRPPVTSMTIISPSDEQATAFSLPVWGLWILLVVVAALAGTALWLNISAHKKQKALSPENGDDKPADAAPDENAKPPADDRPAGGKKAENAPPADRENAQPQQQNGKQNKQQKGGRKK